MPHAIGLEDQEQALARTRPISAKQSARATKRIDYLAMIIISGWLLAFRVHSGSRFHHHIPPPPNISTIRLCGDAQLFRSLHLTDPAATRQRKALWHDHVQAATLGVGKGVSSRIGPLPDILILGPTEQFPSGE